MKRKTYKPMTNTNYIHVDELLPAQKKLEGELYAMLEEKLQAFEAETHVSISKLTVRIASDPESKRIPLRYKLVDVFVEVPISRA